LSVLNRISDGIMGGKSFRLETELSSKDSEGGCGIRFVPVQEIINLSEKYFDNDNLKIAQIYLCFLLSGETNKEIGSVLGDISASRVSQLIKKAESLMETDDSFKNRVLSVEKKLRKRFI